MILAGYKIGAGLAGGLTLAALAAFFGGWQWWQHGRAVERAVAAENRAGAAEARSDLLQLTIAGHEAARAELGAQLENLQEAIHVQRDQAARAAAALAATRAEFERLLEATPTAEWAAARHPGDVGGFLRHATTGGSDAGASGDRGPTAGRVSDADTDPPVRRDE